MLNKDVKIDDFFFGEIYQMKNEVEISLDDVIITAKTSPKNYFNDQLKRLVDCYKSIIMTHETSMPDFDVFMSQLKIDEVGMVVISARTDVNESVGTTLDCTIYFSNGTINVRPHWCGYKETRADEIISTLIAPLIKNGCHERTYVVNSDGERSLIDKDFKDAINTVMSVANSSGVFDSTALENWVRRLRDVVLN